MKGTMVNVLPALLTLGSQALAQDDAPASGLLPAVADLGSQLLGQDEAPASTHCCRALADAGLEDRLIFPGDAEYQESVDTHWSLAARLSPNCFVQPRDAGEVAKVVTTLVEANKQEPCQFAVRSGGHQTWAGAANIEDGVTVDLSNLSEVVYNAENSTASIGPGARWAKVYSTLDALGVAVPGGRASTVGVGGLTTGGGNSFYGAREGFVCDNVIRFEVVLASGEIIQADKDNNVELWQSLKGGSNNFGIVTRLDLATLDGIDLWGGVVTYGNETTQEQIDAMYNFGNEVTNDRFASAISIWQYNTEADANIIISAYDYTKPEANAPIFNEFLAIPGETSNSLRLTNMTDLTIELEQTPGYRDAFFTITFKNNKEVMNHAIKLHHQYLETIKAAAPEGDWTLQDMFQPIPTFFAEHGARKGGNVLGLERFDDNFILWQTYLAWKTPSLDDQFHAWGNQYIDELAKFADSVGAGNPFIYLDYAYKTQDPLASYGEENLAKMKKVAEKYDPEGVFQTMVPGGFKLSKAGTGEQGKEKRGKRRGKREL